MVNLVDAINGIGNLGPFISSKEMHDGVELYMKRLGFTCFREHPVHLPDGSCGRLDLLCRRDGEPLVAMELDWKTPRGGSLKKLLHFKSIRQALTVVALRDSTGFPSITEIDFIVCARRSVP